MCQLLGMESGRDSWGAVKCSQRNGGGTRELPLHTPPSPIEHNCPMLAKLCQSVQARKQSLISRRYHQIIPPSSFVFARFPTFGMP